MVSALIAINGDSINNVPDLYIEGNFNPIIIREIAMPNQRIYFEYFEFITFYIILPLPSKIHQ